MTNRTAVFLAFAALASASSAAQGRLGTLAQGRYQCGSPGDATGPAWRVDPALDFAVTSASGYEAVKGAGTYLLNGDQLTFTRGPMKDMRLRRLRPGVLQQILPDGSLGRIRCHRVGRLSET